MHKYNCTLLMCFSKLSFVKHACICNHKTLFRIYICIRCIIERESRDLDTYNCSLYLLQDYPLVQVPGICNFGSRKRSVDDPIVRHKRQDTGVTVNITLADVTIDQSIVTLINDTLLPPVIDVSLYSGE